MEKEIIAELDFNPSEVFIENLSDTLKDLPPRSREKYVVAYENFMRWKNEKHLDSFSEDVFLAYFEELAIKYKPSSLWCIYSMLKATVKARDDIDMKGFINLGYFLKTSAKGYKSKKANVLTTEHVQKFLDEAPDDRYLVTKVALIFGITGACGRRELADITTKDIEEYGEMFLVRITNKKNKTLRTFTIHGQFYKIVKRYEVLRTPLAKHDRFFQNYQKGSNNLDTNLNASSEGVLDNTSDDDVIEVVRDEAPIEILSDDEEMEVDKSNNLCSFDQTFKFMAPHTPGELDKENLNELEDPLKSCFGEIESTFSISEQEHAIAVPFITHAISFENNPKTNDKTNYDSSGDNCFVNVTDLGNSSENDAEQLKQKVQEENESKEDKDLNINPVNVPNDKIAMDNC